MYFEGMVHTNNRGSLVELTEEIKNIVEKSGINQGLVVVTTTESGVGILCTSFYDKKGHEDIIDDFNRIFPPRLDFNSSEDPWLVAAESKAAIAGQSIDFILENGSLLLGNSQGIFLAEYVSGQDRFFNVTVLGE